MIINIYSDPSAGILVRNSMYTYEITIMAAAMSAQYFSTKGAMNRPDFFRLAPLISRQVTDVPIVAIDQV